MNNQKFKELQDRQTYHENEANKIQAKIQKLRRIDGLQITDHSIVRYLERVKGMNMDTIRKEILTPDVLKYYSQFGDGEFPTGQENVTVRIRNGHIVTVIK